MNNDAGIEIKCEISQTIGVSCFCEDIMYIKFNTDTHSLLSVNLRKKKDLSFFYFY